MKKNPKNKKCKGILRWVTHGLFITGMVLFWLALAVMLTMIAVVACLPFLVRDY